MYETLFELFVYLSIYSQAMKISLRLIALCLLACACSRNSSETIPIISWGGIPADNADAFYSLARECGFDHHLGLYRAHESVMKSMDAAARQGIRVIISHPHLRDSTEKVVSALKNHPALYAYHVKDEPEVSDFQWLNDVVEKIRTLDPDHQSYINLYPNWAWGEEEYSNHIEDFASQIDIPIYSFDHYPVTESDGQINIRPQWYRNLEEFSAMARKHGRPFWAFALTASHRIGPPSPPAFYPVPTIGQIRLQVFSNLLYGAQGIQYFTYAGLVDSKTCQKTPVYDIIRQVNAEIKAYSSVFYGCQVLGVWHTGDSIPSHTQPLDAMPHESVKSLKVSGDGAVVSLLRNGQKTYLAVQNRDCENPAMLEAMFSKKVLQILPESKPKVCKNASESLVSGGVAIFLLK